MAKEPATLRVTSRTTLVTGSADAPVHNPPGTVVELAAEEARDLIARGLVQPVETPAADA